MIKKLRGVNLSINYSLRFVVKFKITKRTNTLVKLTKKNIGRDN